MDILNRNNIIPLIIGELCFVLLFFVSYNIAHSYSYDMPQGLFIAISALLFPIGALAFVKVASFGVRFFTPLLQLAKFALVGVLNTLVDVGLFNILASFFGAATLFALSTIKIVSFIGAVVNSYVFNKFWVFESKGTDGTILGEVASFFTVSVGGLIINIVAFMLASTFLTNLLELPTIVASTGAALIAAATSLLWNFLGYKFFVFK